MKLSTVNQNALLDIRQRLVTEDVKKADNLRRSRAIAKVRPGTGPRVAR